MADMHRIPEIKCLVCDTRLNHAADLKDCIPPNPGDLTICLYCHHLMTFQDDLTLRNATQEELKELEDDPQFAEIKAFTDFYKKVVKH